MPHKLMKMEFKSYLLPWLFSLPLIISTLSLNAAIEPIRSIFEINVEGLKNRQALVVFDVDDTLTILRDPAFHRINYRGCHADLFKAIMDPLSLDERHMTFMVTLLVSSGDLLEAGSPDLIRHLQSEKVKTIALTAAMGGGIQNAQIGDRRCAELARVGIDFSVSFPDVPNTHFTDFPAPVVGSYPLFSNGILFTNDNDKGKVLVAFLKLLSWQPDLVVFVEDRIEHLNAVEKALLHYGPGIEFKGFHYQTARSSYQGTDPDNFRERWLDCVEQARNLLCEVNQ